MRAHLIVVFAVLVSLVARADCHDLVPVDTDDYPWSSIGKLYNGAGGTCTGVAVSRTEVVTAAHCLYNRRNDVLLEATSLHFLIGYRQGEYREDLRISKFATGPDYKSDRTEASERGDWAILTLAHPPAQEIKPVSLANNPPSNGSRVMVGGFGQPKQFIMTADTDCGVREILPNGLLVHDCAVMPGDSGAPLIRSNGDGIEIVGVNVASAPMYGITAKIAVPASSFHRKLIITRGVSVSAESTTAERQPNGTRTVY
jgi:protease YdgD